MQDCTWRRQVGPLAMLLSIQAGAFSAPVTVQVKSFIAAVNINDPTQFDPNKKTCQSAMATLVACGTIGKEDPQSPLKANGGYRLWSEIKADVGCTGNKVSSWNIAPIAIDAGNEFKYITTSGELSPDLRAQPSQAGSTPVDKVSFSYRMRGQPNVTANAIMAAVKPRSCSFIWHTVDGALSCQAGKPVMTAALRGSGFPSHRMWVDGKLVKDLPQGPFDNLWHCDVIDPTMVN